MKLLAFLVVIASMTLGVLADPAGGYWNCNKADNRCYDGKTSLPCTAARPCKVHGNGCTPVDRNGDGVRYDDADCSS
ncbi:hypothetical protein Slin15195_G092220 [Septoria linicola]|uniref:Uncharacterized protein n=1 Tax=Septoria linicola TaxID=215465 RepID=A0A9Q9B1L1_9PEZI|nr:hypothetical protein Slin15195_G092220 [Septoria linicola]